MLGSNFFFFHLIRVIHTPIVDTQYHLTQWQKEPHCWMSLFKGGSGRQGANQHSLPSGFGRLETEESWLWVRVRVKRQWARAGVAKSLGREVISVNEPGSHRLCSVTQPHKPIKRAKLIMEMWPPGEQRQRDPVGPPSLLLGILM